MERLTKRAEDLLREILVHRDKAGNCESNYWENRFENLSISEDAIIRSLFKELREASMISVQWADNYPYFLVVLANGISYFDEIEKNYKEMQSAYTNNFYGPVTGVQIQQGTYNSTQSQKLQDSERIAKELIEIIKKYDAVLEVEYGESAALLRKSAENLEMLTTKTSEPSKIKAVMNYIKELSINAGGGLIASGIVHLLSTMR